MPVPTTKDEGDLKAGTGWTFATILRPIGPGFGSKDRLSLAKKECLASWSWKDVMNPTIYVPGCPAIWANPSSRSPPRNAVTRSPPFDAVFKALLARDPKFDLSSLSIISNRNSMWKLLNYALGYGRTTWRIDIDVVGETVFFSRWDVDNTKVIRDWSYGKEVEKCCTYLPKGVEDSASHHRLYRYSIGDVEFDMYHETDACTEKYPEYSTGAETCIPANLQSLFNLSDPTLGVPSFEEFQKLAEHDVKVEYQGSYIDDSTIINLIPRMKGKRQIDFVGSMPQTWLTNCQKSHVGIHNSRGRVESVEVHDMVPHYQNFEDRHQGELQIFVDTLKQIKNAVLHRMKKRPGCGGKFALVGYCFGNAGEKKQLWLYDRKGEGVTLAWGVREKLEGAVS